MWSIVFMCVLVGIQGIVIGSIQAFDSSSAFNNGNGIIVRSKKRPPHLDIHASFVEPLPYPMPDVGGFLECIGCPKKEKFVLSAEEYRLYGHLRHDLQVMWWMSLHARKLAQLIEVIDFVKKCSTLSFSDLSQEDKEQEVLSFNQEMIRLAKECP